jgi:hypothetical protein
MGPILEDSNRAIQVELRGLIPFLYSEPGFKRSIVLGSASTQEDTVLYSKGQICDLLKFALAIYSNFHPSHSLLIIRPFTYCMSWARRQI